MKRFCVLVTICLVLIVTLNKIHLAEDVENSVSDDTQEMIEITNNEAVPAEDNKEEEMSQEEWEKKEQIAAGKSLFEKKCNKCHKSQKALLTKKTMNEWKEIVEKMQKKDFIWILPAEVLTIADYLFEINGIKEIKEIEPDTTSQLIKAE